MLTLEEAREKILAAIEPLDTETVPLLEAERRILAEPVTATLDLPSFDNSAMDGYALLASDTLGASTERPRRLRVAVHVPAGNTSRHLLQSGECARIFTGSPLPRGADAVVMQEDVRIPGDAPDHIELTDPAAPWEHVRLQGEDVKRGSPLLDQGIRLGAAHLSLLAAQGRSEVRVGRKPRAGILSTGSELTEPGQPLRPGHIYESNRTTLAILTRQAGAAPEVLPLVPDDLEATQAALSAALATQDVLITSGGVSVGEHDVVKEAFTKLGGRTEFWRLAIKPGKPFVFGRLGSKLWFGLPGNPISALVTHQVLVRPALLRMQGAVSVEPHMVTGTLGQPIVNHSNRRHFLRVVLTPEGEVHSAGAQSSHTLQSMAAANALLDVPAATGWREGSTVKVMLLPG